jgi:hypothetical protein
MTYTEIITFNNVLLLLFFIIVIFIGYVISKFIGKAPYNEKDNSDS